MIRIVSKLLSWTGHSITLERILYFNIIGYPIITSVLRLTKDIINLHNHGLQFLLKDVISFYLLVAMVLCITISTASNLLLYKGIQNRSLRTIEVYTILYFIFLLIDEVLLAFKNQRDSMKLELELGPFFSVLVDVLNIWLYMLAGSSLLIFLEVLKMEKGYPLRMTVLGFQIEKILLLHVGYIWVCCLYVVVMYGITAFEIGSRYIELAVPVLLLLSSIIGSGCNALQLCAGIRKKNSSLIRRFRIIKILFVIPSCISWRIVNFRRAEILGKPTEAITRLLPVFVSSVVLLEIVLIDLYLKQLVHYPEGQLPELLTSVDKGMLSRLDTVLQGALVSHVPVTIDHEDCLLGSGDNSEVRKGKLSKKFKSYKAGATVAVKILLSSNFTSKDYLTAVISEVEILTILNNRHENLVKFIGVTSKNIMGQGLSIVMEYCSRGSLQNYLRTKRRSPGFPENITNSDLTKLKVWAGQVASAMQFIGGMNIIHGDLAARNVLLDGGECAKVTDFGMSLKLYNYQIYARSSQSIFPWRWMAPEALTYLNFSPKSDVWSYGVLLWELYTFGQIPWGGLDWTSDFVEILKLGISLQKPTFASDELYSGIIRQCLSFNQKDRPQFTEITKLLHSIGTGLTTNDYKSSDLC